jgi:hypothetical protein
MTDETVDVEIEELCARLLLTEGKVWGLTQLLRSFIRLEIIPRDAARKQIKEMLDLLNPDPAMNEKHQTFVGSAHSLVESLIAEADAVIPRFSVIQGGKADKPD